MHFLLNLGYVGLWLLLLPTLAWHWLRGLPLPEASVGRALGLVARRTSQRPCVWLHGESLGEMNVLLALLPALAERLADWEIVIAAGTSSGRQLAAQRAVGHRVLYCPLDLPRAAANVLDRIRPDAIVVVESSRQPNLIAAAKARGIPRTLVNGRVLARHGQSSGLPPARQQRLLRDFGSILAQTDEDSQRLAECGVSTARIRVGGAVKFDNARYERDNPATQRLARLAGIEAGDTVWLAGSTREGEEEIVVRVFASLACEFPRLKLVLVPRHARRFDDACKLLEQHEVTFQRRTWLETWPADPAARALVVDVFGELPAWWGLARLGFVGNSLTQHGGQNMIEPAAYGVATCFGPHTENFQDVVELLLQADGALVVHSEAELRSFVRRCLVEPAFAAQLGRRAQQAVASQSGALERTIEHLEQFFARIARPDCRTLSFPRSERRYPLRAAS